MRLVFVVLIVAALGLLALSASADINAGGQARFLALGGAGLACTDSPALTSTVNPAALGMLPKRLSFIFPNVGFQTDGATLSSISDWADDIWDLSGTEGVDFARQFGKQATMLDVTAGTGLMGGPIGIGADGEARIRIIPNAAFQEFARTGNLPDDPSQMQATVWAEAAASLPSISLGFKVPGFATGKGDMWIGTRLRYVRGTYVRRTVSWSGSMDPNDPLATSDEPVQNESGIGGDLGMIYRAPGPSRFSVGLVATDLFKPGLGNISQDTSWNVGIAVEPMAKMLFVADLVNLTNAYDEGVDLRCGLEFRPIRMLALRAGYSGDALTTGIGIFGMDFAFSSNTPLSISRTIRF